MVSTTVSIPGYKISEQLYNGSRTLVYRGYRDADSLPVVIKLLKNPYPTFSELLSFRNQYTIAKNLNSPLIIQTYSLEPHQNGYALVMEDFGGISLKDYFISEQGNPFFATQLLKALHQENLIKFDFELGCWQCEIAQVSQQAVTDDVVAFMAFQLEKLPDSTQQRLQLAACIGNQFNLATLVIVSSQSEIETAMDLWKALQEGLIFPIGDVYKFYVGQEIEIVTQENQETVTYKSRKSFS